MRNRLRRFSRWLVGMVERCCRVRRCGHVSRVVMRRAASRRRMKAAVVIVIVMTVEIVVDVGGIAGVDAMSRRDAGANVRTRHGPSIVRSRVGLVLRRL